LLFADFLVKSISHQQTLLQNAANSGFLFGNRCFYFHYLSIRLHLARLLQLFLKALLVVLSGCFATPANNGAFANFVLFVSV